MSLSPVKCKILENMLLNDKPARAMQIAKETQNNFPPVMMHILSLIRVGYAKSPEKGLYAITENGKRALGIPETTRETAKAILAQTSEKPFHFYSALGKPSSFYANSLQDFCGKILKVDVESVEFHLERGDFESWFAGLGDCELAKKMALLKEKKMNGEELRKKLHEILDNRCKALAAMS
jgi:hypothetical protein